MQYTVLSPVRHNGTLYEEKEILELDDQAAAPLLDCQAIALLPDQPESETEPEKNETTGAQNETSTAEAEPEPTKPKSKSKKAK